MKKYDVIVIGTGAANIVTDAALAQACRWLSLNAAGSAGLV